MLEQVEEGVLGCGLIERRRVPGVDDDDPEADRQHRMHQRSEVAQARGAEDRPEHRAGEPDREQQGRLVGEHRVLDHVAEDEVVPELVQRPHRGHQQQEEAAAEAQLAKRRWRVPVPGEVGDPAKVRDGERQGEQQFDQRAHGHES